MSNLIKCCLGQKVNKFPRKSQENAGQSRDNPANNCLCALLFIACLVLILRYQDLLFMRRDFKISLLASTFLDAWSSDTSLSGINAVFSFMARSLFWELDMLLGYP